MDRFFTYKAFGLIFQSEFEIPELKKEFGQADIEIILGKTPLDLREATKQGVKYQATKNEFLLELDHIARYYVKDGNKIVVELLKGEADKEVRLFLLGSAFGALFLQRGLLPIHGSTVIFNNSATLFTGLSGVGKSSIAAFFASQGFKVLADDISVVNHNLEVEPGFPSLKIWNDVLNILNVKKDSLKEIRPNIKKYQMPIENSFFETPYQVKNIIILSTKNTPGFEIEELTGIKKFNAIKNNTYRYRFVKGLEKQQEHFKILNELLPKIKVYKLARPQAPLALNGLGDFILNNLELDV